MGYEVGSHLRGKGEDVPCAQDGDFGETRVGKVGSSPWDKDVPHAWHGSQEVTLPELSVLGPEETCLFHLWSHQGQRCPWRGHVEHGSGPVRGKELHAGGQRPPTATQRQCSHP